MMKRFGLYLPEARMTNNPRVYEGHVEFQHIQVGLIFANELLLGCGPLPDWLHRMWCIYAIDSTDDNLCVWQCLIIPLRIRNDQTRPAEDTMRETCPGVLRTA